MPEKHGIYFLVQFRAAAQHVFAVGVQLDNDVLAGFGFGGNGNFVRAAGQHSKLVNILQVVCLAYSKN